MLAITPATDAEREWCAELMARSEPWITLRRDVESCRAACRDPEHLLWIAHMEDKPCGFARLHPHGLAGSPYIASIAIAEDFRGQGLGRLLLDHVEQYFARTARHIFLCVSSFNHRARQLYERRGYLQVGELKDYVIDGASEILMHKRLT